MNQKMEVEVRIYKDRMELSAGNEFISVEPKTPFSTSRLLVGEFHPAVDCLRRGLVKLGVLGFFKSKPALRIRSMEINSGGLSTVERRCLLEVGSAAGGKRVQVE